MKFILGIVGIVSLFAFDIAPDAQKEVLKSLKKLTIIKVSKGLSPLGGYSNSLTGKRSELVYGSEK